MYPGSLVDWYIGPQVSYNPQSPLTPPKFAADFHPAKAGWHRFDRAAELPKASCWQKSWLERGGVMPLGGGHEDFPSRGHGRFRFGRVSSPNRYRQSPCTLAARYVTYG